MNINDLDLGGLASFENDELIQVEKSPELNRHNTGEIGQMAYTPKVPPTRHNRMDSQLLKHKKRGTFKDIKDYKTPTPEPPQQQQQQTQLHTDFSFDEELKKNENGLGDIADIIDKAKEDDHITPISKQNYGIKEPPKKHLNNQELYQIYAAKRESLKGPGTGTSSMEFSDDELIDIEQQKNLKGGIGAHSFMTTSDGSKYHQIEGVSMDNIELHNMQLSENMEVEMLQTSAKLTVSTSGSSSMHSPSPISKQIPQSLPNPTAIVANHQSIESINSVASEKGPQRLRQVHVPSESLHSLQNMNTMNIDMHKRLASLDMNVENENDSDSEHSIVINENVENVEVVDIFNQNEVTDDEGTDINKKKGYTRSMNGFIPSINTEIAHESMEISKQIQDYIANSNTPISTDTPTVQPIKRKRKKIKKSHSQQIDIVNYDQNIDRPEFDQNVNSHSSRNKSVKSKRSSRSSKRGSAKSSRKNSTKSKHSKYEKNKNKKNKKHKRQRKHASHSNPSTSFSHSVSYSNSNDEEESFSSSQSAHRRA